MIENPKLIGDEFLRPENTLPWERIAEVPAI
jgi:hypothetical protein